MSPKVRYLKGVDGMMENNSGHEAGQQTAERWGPHAVGVSSVLVDSRKYFVSSRA